MTSDTLNRLGTMTALAAACAGLLFCGAGSTANAAGMRTYETKYYTVYSDLDIQNVRAAVQRITLMAEEYHRRTKEFGRTVNKRLPFYLFGSLESYTLAGGPIGTAGYFDGTKLVALVLPEASETAWQTIQHEGFHQFVDAAIGREIPIWANEGMAEYFGYGIFTGDDFYTGAIPPEMLKTVKTAIKENRFKNLNAMMRLSHRSWNEEMDSLNYAQAWSMVYFMAHADERYQKAFVRFLRAVSRGTDWEKAWTRACGTDTAAFELRWKEYWLGLPDNPTAEIEAQATVSTLTSFYARAFAKRQFFDDFEAFVRAAKAGQIQVEDEDWLPPYLLSDALERMDKVGEWSLKKLPGRRLIICETKDGTTYQGAFKISRRRVKNVTVRTK